MEHRMMRDLLRRLEDVEKTSARLRIGEVTDDSPLSVDLGGSGVAYTPVKKLTSYSPVAGDIVAVVVRGNDLLVLGKIN